MAGIRRNLFVYGSLLSGLHNNSLLLAGNAVCLGTTSITGGYVLADLGSFPAVVPKEGVETTIKGEVWSVSDRVWETIEHLEGYPTFYNRKSVVTPLGEATMYILDEFPTSRKIVENGDWRNHVEK